MQTLLLKTLALAALSIGAMVIPVATALFAGGKDINGQPLVNIRQLMPKSRVQQCLDLQGKAIHVHLSNAECWLYYCMDCRDILRHNSPYPSVPKKDISDCGFRRDDDLEQRWAWGYKQYRYGEYPEIEISTISRTRDNSRIILPEGF